MRFPSKSILEIFDRQDEENRKIIDIPVENIIPSRYQPRLRFDEESLKELSESIQENGLIQPITVREIENGYELIAGERRYRACCMAGYKTIPAYIMTPTEDQAAQLALVENIQREDLSAIEEAKSYVQIMRQAGLTQDQIAKKVGKSQSAVANKIRLLNLPQEIQQHVIDGRLTERHARALLTVPEEEQKNVCNLILEKKMNVRETEEYIEKNGMEKKSARRKKRQKTKGFTRNTKIAVNSVNQCVEMIRKLGIQAELETEETDDDVRMTIIIPR